MILRSRLAKYVRGVFGLDYRSLAAFRIAIGLLLLADLANRSTDLAAMYTDDGIAPVSLVRDLQHPGEWSLHLLNGTAAYQRVLFVIAGAFAVGMTLGYRTRISTVGSWLLLCSLHVRLPIVLNAGDSLLRLLLFWGMFLPLGVVWSLDSRNYSRPRSDRVVSVATVALVFQIAFVYWGAGWVKLNSDWLGGGALDQIFAFSFYGLPLGRLLHQVPDLTALISWGIVVLELAGPFLLFVPWTGPRLRLFTAFLFIAFHLGIALTLTVGLFPWVGIVAWIALLPTPVWARVDLHEKNGVGRSEAVVSSRSIFRGNALAAKFLPALCLPAMCLMLYWNVADIFNLRSPKEVRSKLQWAANATMLRQSWRVFDVPPQYDSRFIYQGRLMNGTLVDLWTGKPPAILLREGTEPHSMPNHRWRKLHWRVATPAAASYRLPLARYVWQRWNKSHRGDQLAVRMDFVVMRRPLKRGAPEGEFINNRLASLTLNPQWGNFADALREIER